MTPERQKIVDRIKKLLALGDSSFDEEARNSLHLAHKDMKKHGVSFTELAGLEQKPREPTDDELTAHAAVLLSEHMADIGREGGLKGGRARALKLSAKRRKDIARAAGKASGEARRRNRGY
jgi:hypothetical protein